MSSAVGQVLSGGAGGYEATKISRISESLSRLFSDLQQNSNVFSRAASTNVLLPVGSADAVQEVERLIEDVARLHPSRFVIFGVNNALPGVAAEVSARCHFTSKGAGTSQHVCSELVRFGAPGAQIGALAESIRANLVSGTPSELVLFDSEVEQELLGFSSEIADSVIFDSAMWVDRLSSVEALLHQVRFAVDLQWIALGAWRDQVRASFGVPHTRGLLPGLERITIVSDLRAPALKGSSSRSRDITQAGERAVPELCSMAGLLFGGWILSRLHLNPVSVRTVSQSDQLSSQGLTIQCVSPSGATVTCNILNSADNAGVTPRFFAGPEASEPKVRLARFEGIGRGGKETVVEIERKQSLLFSTVKGAQSLEMSRPLEDETGEGRLRRYFLIGESVANYSNAMGEVCKICALV